MSIRKPVTGTVGADDFRDKAYSFVVESVRSPEDNPGVLLLSTSVGYLLTTSRTSQAKREQIVRYNRQSDGSWLATDVVTLLATEEPLPDGTVIIRDASAESVVLTINPIPTSLSNLPAAPALLVSEPVLTFAGTAPGEPSFQVLTIAQQRSNAPVTLTTDAPDYFQFASDSQPAFAPSLTLTPSPVGTYVHVRYAAKKYGAHTGQLMIQGSAGSETVTLRGRNAGLLTALRPAHQVTPALTRRKAGLLALTLSVGLAYAGYSARCQLFPALCQAVATTSAVADTPVPVPVSESNKPGETDAVSRKRIRTTVAELPEPTRQRTPSRTPASRPDGQPTSTTGGRDKQNSVSSSRSVVRSPKLAVQPDDDSLAKRTRRRVLTPLPTQESELERELNGNLKNQF